MPVKIIAIPGDHPGLGGHGLEKTAKILAKAAASRGHKAIPGYAGIDALFDAIDAILDASHDCLEILEISSHGDALACDGIAVADGTGKDERRSAKEVARRISKLALCDTLAIYLSGCNTGLPGVSARPGTRSIAQHLADALPRFSPTYQHRITVWGTRGYFGGTHMGGNGQCRPIVWGSLEPRAADYPSYDGAVTATGNDCWTPFKNGW